MTLRKRYQILKSDRVLFAIFLIHLLLAFFHIAYSFYTVYPQCYIRCGFCLLIAIATFFFLRTGFSYSILIYAYVLVYFNNFFNYTSFLFVLFSIYCNPKIKKHALLLYALDVFVIFAIKQNAILTLGIHGLNCLFFYLLSTRVFGFIPESTLLLTDDERYVLTELASGKLQKQIEKFSPNTVTKLLKNAMERNKCKTKTELQHRFLKENPHIIHIAIESQADEIESQEQSQEKDA